MKLARIFFDSTLNTKTRVKTKIKVNCIDSFDCFEYCRGKYPRYRGPSVMA
jgi:hypothetical protein